MLGVAQPPRELDLAPYRDAARGGLGQQRRRRRPSGRGDQHVHALGQDRGGPRAEAYVGAEDLQQGALLAAVAGVGLVHHHHVGALVGQVVRGGEAGHAHAGDGGAHALPGVVAAELVQRSCRAHTPATHSA